MRPPRARKEKPRVSAFTSVRLDRIVALEPDLVLGFSDLQADIASGLIRRGIEVHVFNQRSVPDILRMLRTLGGMIGCEATTSSRSCPRSRSVVTASSPSRSRSRDARRRSPSVRGAARSSTRGRSWRALAGKTCRQCATASCTR
jgi:iron complex transport system substrate-binding protein